MSALPVPPLPPLPADVYPPAEDSHLLLDTLGAPAQRAFLTGRFAPRAHLAAPLVLDLGTGSGIALAFATAHARALFGRPDVLTAAVDLHPSACRSARAGGSLAAAGPDGGAAALCGVLRADGGSTPLRAGSVDVVVANPPYVPTDEVPGAEAAAGADAWAREGHALAAAWSGGAPDGMRVAAGWLAALPRLLGARGCAYVLLCARNGPAAVARAVRRWGREGPRRGWGEGWWRGEGEMEGGDEGEMDGGDEEGERGRWWTAEIVGRSGGQGGWERLFVVRIERVLEVEAEEGVE